MPTDIVIPTVGESITEGVIGAWLKSDGDYVDRDEPILEIETDKITVEVPAPVAGLIKTGAGEGDTVQVGAVVGSIDESADVPAAKQGGAKTESEVAAGGSGASSAKSATATKERAASEPQPPASASKNGAASPSEDIRMTPLARKIADENGVNASTITGTGPGGRIREQDVIAFMQKGAASTAASKPVSAAPAFQPSPRLDSREITRERMKPLRQKIAQRLVEAQHTAAMLTTFNECDMSQVMALRARHKEAFQKKHGVKLGFMSFFIKAAVSALESYPLVNAQIATGDSGPEILKHHYCDIAVAVGTDKGLVVPVVRNCESLSFAQIESALVDLATRARDGKLGLEEMQGGTFTISNGGVYGSMMSTPILNPPQSGILGMHNIIRRPVENPDKPGSGEVTVRPMMYLALSYDHRVVDGAGAVGFLKHIKANIESPESMLLGV